MLSAGTPNLNKVYEDDKATVLIHQIEGRLVIHVDVVPTTNKEYVHHYYDIIESLFEQLRGRGVKEVETWVREGKEMNFAQFYGFDQFEGEILLHGVTPMDPPVYLLKKVL